MSTREAHPYYLHRRTVEENLNVILGYINRYLAPSVSGHTFTIEIGIWDYAIPPTYYAVLKEDGVIQLGENSYGALSLAGAVADLLLDIHEYIDSLEDDE